MFRLLRGLVAEGLGLGGLLWAMSLLSGDESKTTQRTPPVAQEMPVPFALSEPVTLRKPAIFASLDPPAVEPFTPKMPTFEAERSTFFRGTNSLLEPR